MKKSLSFKRICFFAYSNIATKKARVIVIILLAFVCLVSFGICISAINYDSNFQEAKFAFENKNETYFFKLDGYLSSNESAQIVNDKKECLQVFDSKDFYEFPESDSKNPYYYPNMYSAVIINNEVLSDRQFSLYMGVLPANKNEICVTRYFVESLIYSGIDEYRVIRDEDILGRTLEKKYKIVGIIDTKVNPKYDVLRTVMADEFGRHKLYYEFYNDILANNNSVHRAIYVNSDYIENKEEISAVVCFPKTQASLYKTLQVAKTNDLMWQSAISNEFLFINEMMSLMRTLSAIIVLVIVLVLAFSIFIFIKNSIELNYKQIGILRSLGATKMNVFLIYLMQSLIVFVVPLLFAIPTTILSAQLFSASIIQVSLINITFNVLPISLNYIATVIFSFLALVVFSCIIPFISLLKLKPNQLVNKI
ncbi:MAG: ABC transporter permease [Clostridia bacterium]